MDLSLKELHIDTQAHTHTQEFFDSVYLQIMPCYKWMFSVRQKMSICLIMFWSPC